VPDIAVARLLDEVAHGLRSCAHSSACSCLEVEVLQPLDSQDGTPGLSPGPAHLVTPSVPLAPLRAQRAPA
jgi:hypothetical protein